MLSPSVPLDTFIWKDPRHPSVSLLSSVIHLWSRRNAHWSFSPANCRTIHESQGRYLHPIPPYPSQQVLVTSPLCLPKLKSVFRFLWVSPWMSILTRLEVKEVALPNSSALGEGVGSTATALYSSIDLTPLLLSWPPHILNVSEGSLGKWPRIVNITISFLKSEIMEACSILTLNLSLSMPQSKLIHQDYHFSSL